MIDQRRVASGHVTSGDVARVASVTRDEAFDRLRALADGGELEHHGAERGSHYRRRALRAYHYSLDGLSENDVWMHERSESLRRDLEEVETHHIMVLHNFTGVRHAGRGVIDELFRVWQHQHPECHLVAVITDEVADKVVRLTK